MEKDAGRGEEEGEEGLLRGESVYAKELNSIINISKTAPILVTVCHLNQICTEEGTSIEKINPSVWVIGKSMKFFLY